MIAELVKFRIPAGIGRAEVLAAARETAGAWAAHPELLRKHYLLDDHGFSYGFYLWTSRAAAEAAHDDAFRQRVRAKFGSDPEFSYFDVLLNLDNLAGTVSEELLPSIARTP